MCALLSQTDANSQLHVEMKVWEDVWPEVTEASVLEGNSQRTRGVWPERPQSASARSPPIPRHPQ